METLLDQYKNDLNRYAQTTSHAEFMNKCLKHVLKNMNNEIDSLSMKDENKKRFKAIIKQSFKEY